MDARACDVAVHKADVFATYPAARNGVFYSYETCNVVRGRAVDRARPILAAAAGPAQVTAGAPPEYCLS